MNSMNSMKSPAAHVIVERVRSFAFQTPINYNDLHLQFIYTTPDD